MDKHDLYLALGSNLGDKLQYIQQAIKLINNNIGEVVSVSSMYTTEPMGFESDNLFINAACYVKTSLTPFEALTLTQDIEKQMGRVSKSYNKTHHDRTIDIDILMYDNIILKTTGLILPHPHMHERNFVLSPLAEIASTVIHPVFHKTIGELHNNLKE